MVTVGVDGRVVERRLAEGAVALPGVPGPAGWVGACPGAGYPGAGRGRLAAASAPVTVRGLRGHACSAAGELPAAPGDAAVVIWAGLTARRRAGAPDDRGRAGQAGFDGAGLAGRFASRAGLVRGVFTVWLCALDADPLLLARRVGGGGRGGRFRRGQPPRPAAAWPGRLVGLRRAGSPLGGAGRLAPRGRRSLINTSSG